MSWFLVILFLTLTFGSLSECSHDKRLPSAVVVGSVYCDTCFQQEFSLGSHFISGASVAVECKDGNSKPRFRKEVKTNEHGEFKVQLPFTVSKHVKRIKGCTFKLVSSSEPECAVASKAATSSSLSLKSRNQGEHIFSAGIFSFKPTKKPNNNLCNQKPTIQNSKKPVNYVKNKFSPNIDPSFPPPLQDPPTTPSIIPPLPSIPGLSPLPQIPPLLPPLPGIPLSPPLQDNVKDPNPTKKASEKPQLYDNKKAAHPQFFIFPPLIPNPFQPPPLIPNPFQPPPLIPNPFQPPPAPLIPNPFQPPSPPPFLPNPFQPPPSPPPFLPNPFQPPPSPTPPLIPNPFQPPPSPPRPSPLFPFPPIPGLTPSPPPPSPPPPAFPFPLPPLFPPLFPPPHSPGPPPTSSFSKTISP